MIFMTMKKALPKTTSTVSIAEAKARFSECVRSAEGGDAVLITRHGKPVVAVVSAEDLHHLERLRAAGPEGGLASIAGGWAGSEELADEMNRLRRSPSRVHRPGR